jgi:hypothetical protein
MTKRHRRKPDGDHFYPGPKYWRCINCGLHKITEWEEKPRYHMGNREWVRFAPPCPPEPAGCVESPAPALRTEVHRGD